jgi:hypothetical protein
MASLAKQAEQFVSGYDRAAGYAALGRTDDASRVITASVIAKCPTQAPSSTVMRSTKIDPLTSAMLVPMVARLERYPPFPKLRSGKSRTHVSG